ncbi:hypothetical protein B0I32_106194 [Nonomuraea fuscirosea]|uniref:Uncharacterized protein n=1 Tax=Nonomuraea fuscirosea TaxID=1291556 RepID=A0A2T0N244_9ACTN|nr:hypothetical protein B0I32_106194 [Nonomuraea fuscirosea]
MRARDLPADVPVPRGRLTPAATARARMLAA